MADVVDETYFVTDVQHVMENIEAVWAARADASG
jgi:enamine deaminase RidA (YjgF/YER057c/UK114 family)